MSTVALDEYELMQDPKYRLYVGAVDKALKYFESTEEWQDLITALSKLNKVLKENQRFPVIPRRIKISKRLAQCMHFTLPAGVHLKAIETYDTIFKCMGTGRLSHELFIYSAGLFPLLGHSAMTVKPPLLEVYENHFVPLGPRLRPGLSGFLSGVLPGLEEGSDHFERTNSLLEKVCEGVGSSFFYGSLWECVSCNSAIRLPAISFVLDHYNKKLKVEDQSHIMGIDTTVMVNGLCAGVQDSNVLVQRNSLELLMGIFPMHNNYLRKEDVISLVTAALTTIQRRDISLNRRLYAWLLGTDINASEFDTDHPMIKLMGELGDVTQSSVYFDMYSKENLIQGVRNILGNENMSYSDIRPYRLLMSLLDKPDVGPVIIDDILFEIFRTLYLACKEEKNENNKQRQEILNSANLLFNTFEPGYIWQYAGCLFDQACKKNIEELTTISEIEYSSVVVKPVGSGIPNVWEICELYEFLLGVIPLEACGDSPREYLFHLLIHIIPQLTKYMESLSEDQIARTLKFCSVILAKVQSLTRSRKLSRSESISGDSLAKNYKLDHINPAVIRSRAGTDLNQRPPSEDNHSVSTDSLYMSLECEAQLSAENQNLLLAFDTILKNYEIFYVTLVGSGRIIHSQMVPEVFDKMRRKIDYSDESEYANQLKRILTAVMNDDDTTELFYRRNRKSETVDCSTDVAVEGNEKWEESFKVASEILVQLTSFPRIYTEHRHDDAVFTPWMKVLVVCACCLVKSPKLQLIAVRTFLNLLSASQADDKREIVGLFNSSHAHFLEHDTSVIEIIARTLWKHLGDLTSDLQVTCIELIYHLHSTFSFDDCVERVLGEALLKGTENGQIEALQRFMKLWHVGRDLQSKELKHKKLFHRCLLKLLDNLLLTENSTLKIETQTWLVQSLMRGDIARLLDPILTMLLDPATARMSILHVSIQHSSANPEAPEQANQGTDSANKIYAISSVDGNVIYHVSNAESAKGVFPKRLKWRWKKESSLPDRGGERIYAITSLKNHYDSRPSYVTKKNMMRDIELPRNYNRNISVLVNPFSTGFPEDEFTVDDDQRSESESQIEYKVSEYNKKIRSLRELDRFSDGNIEMDVLPRHSKITLEVTTSDSPPAEMKFFNQLQQKLFGGEEVGCEESLSAYEYFNSNRRTPVSPADNNFTVVREVLDSLIDSVVRKCESESAETDSIKSGVGVHPYHSHIFLYCGVYDSSRTLYAFNTLKNILLTNSRLFLCCAATSGILNAPFSSDLLISLARHRKSVFGRSFHGDGATLNEYISVYRSNMYLEILVSVCLYFARSYYPNLGLLRLTADEIAGNRQVQLTSIEILMHIFTELIPIVRDSGRGFANYIDDLLLRYKVQKIILHCLMSSIHYIQQQLNGGSNETKTFTEEIIDFNDPHVTKSNQKGVRLTEYSEALQIQLLKVLLALIILERHIDVQKVDSSDLQCAKENSQLNNQEARYVSDTLIPLQPIFLEAVSSALKLKGPMRLLHYNWTELVTSSLPYLGSALPQVVSITINQICANIEELTAAYSASKCDKDDCLPADYAINQLEALTVLCHFCVLDSSQQVSPVPLASVAGLTHSGMPGSNPGQIFNNLLDVFAPAPLTQEAHKEKSEQLDVLLSARRCVLGSMPRIICSLASLWQAVTEVDEDSDDVCIWGNYKVVKNQILVFLSPISFHHGPIFLSAIAVAWQERKEDNNNMLLPVASPSQKVLVNLVSSIRVMPIESLVQTVHLVVKQHPTVQGAPLDDSLEVSVLELFYIYMQSSTSSQLWESWSSLLGLLRDGLMLSPPALFLILAILNEWVQKCPPFQDKKDQRDLQDITSKLVEACGNVAGACLEQKTWLGRVFTPVKVDPESPDETANTSASNILQQHSIRAQLVLAQVLAPLLDITYGSQEKEKVATLLTKLMDNILPHLKNHSPENTQSFQACSQLLANLSGFQYTRKAWKRDVFDLLLSSSLFQMEFDCLSHWTTIIDNLMTNDMTTFRDLMSKVAGLQSGSYSLFSSKGTGVRAKGGVIEAFGFCYFLQ
ncbi:UNVERIFIED_CONTAM: hypothetical protein PYX00_006399 [Menopon gallinae]|uniref:Dopey N-terminal domain-containing protein n=1 Tax=Menopon gallinae TaxID=328185 RepID=A0AAW2HW10_9NEOP